MPPQGRGRRDLRPLSDKQHLVPPRPGSGNIAAELTGLTEMFLGVDNLSAADGRRLG